MMTFLDIFRHLPEHIAQWSALYGAWVYGLLFLIIFAETGFVFTPLLPGDSLLFACGALTAEGVLQLPALLIVLTAAAILGDFTNFTIGGTLGLRLCRSYRLVNPVYLERAEMFYKRHGRKAVIMARFFPIIRTYAPFAAGLSGMERLKYLSFNIVGATLWIWLFLLGGRMFGNLPFVKQRFEYIIFGIIFVSLLPAAWEFYRTRASLVKSKP